MNASIAGDVSMRMKLGGLFIAVCVLGAAVSTFAHHGYSTEFDGAKCMDLRGILTGLIWENPHGYFDLDVKDAGGKTNSWHIELLTPNAMRRNGTTRADFQANMGKVMDARVCPAKLEFGENRASAEYIKMADGIIRTVGQLPEKITPQELSFWKK
jgi:hypothetical protein